MSGEGRRGEKRRRLRRSVEEMVKGHYTYEILDRRGFNKFFKRKYPKHKNAFLHWLNSEDSLPKSENVFDVKTGGLLGKYSVQLQKQGILKRTKKPPSKSCKDILRDRQLIELRQEIRLQLKNADLEILKGILMTLSQTSCQSPDKVKGDV